MRVINLRTDIGDLPGSFAKLKKEWPRDTARALNETAFKIAPVLTARAQSDLGFTVGGIKQALGIKRTQRATPSRLEAITGTNRQWVVSQVDEGQHTPRQGVVYKGRRYLMVAIEAKMGRGGRRKLRASRRRGKRFIVESGGRILMLERFAPGKDGVKLIGSLHLETEYGNEFGWQDEIRREATDLFQREWDKAFAVTIRKAMGR